MTELSGQFIKGYELKERLGAGGFGAVCRAYQSTVGREVAIKIILPGFANHPDFIRRFEAEAQIIARLEHLHIVPLYDYWRDPDGAYLVMRWMRGGSLRDLLSKEGPCDLERTGQILDQITSALATAHRAGIIHRDLKPGNILLDEDGNAYLADFGIAKDLSRAAPGSTEPDAMIGSPDYLSPEQVRSESVSPASDIYSLGVVLYEMLAGEHPFPNVSTVERLYKHLSDPLPIIDTLDSQNRDAINAVIHKATAKDPKVRFNDARALMNAFHEAAALRQPATDAPVLETLTRKEQEILHLIIEGRSNKEIADHFVVTLATVKWYITQIYRKLRVRSRMQAIIRARELNLVTSPATDTVSIAAVQIEPDNPYKGLRAFETADYRDFFGRERLVSRLTQRMAESGQLTRFLAVIGPSGSGKSSLVKAGLIPAIWRGEVTGSDKWFVVEMVPGERPLDQLEVALTRIAATQTGNLREQLQRDAHGLIRGANLVLPNDHGELVLIIDQFEELFSSLIEESARTHFLELIHTAVTERRSRVRVVITLRADFYDRPLQYANFGELVRSRMETLMPLGAKELEDAIVSPAERVGVTFESGLVGTIIDDILYQPAALPLLQYALTELFERRDGLRLTRSAYDDMGGASGALAKRAEDLFREFDRPPQDTIRQIFLRLVTLDASAADTRHRTPRSELLALGAESDLTDDIIDTFVAHRLLSVDHDRASHRPTVEIAHEALLREWDRLSGWLVESREDIKMQQQVARLAGEWRESRNDASFLIRGGRLQQIAMWSQQTDLRLTPGERAYIDACLVNRDQELSQESAQRAHEARLERRSQTFLKGLVVVVAVGALMAVTLAVIALRSEAAARRQAVISQSLSLASGARAAFTGEDNALALALAVAANQIESPPVFAQRTLYEVALAPGTQSILAGGSGWRWIAEPSPDRSLLAVQEDDVRVALWDLQSRTVVMRLDGQHPDGLGGLAFTPDSQGLLVGAWDDSLQMWDLSSGEVLWQAVNPAGDPNSVAVTPDGSIAIVGSERGTATLWDAHTGDYLGELAGHAPDLQILGTASSPDSRQAASASEDGTVIIWDIATREVVHRLEGHAGIVFDVSFSPDGLILASSAFDNTVILWDVETGDILRQLNGHTDFVFSVDWSPDGRRLLSASRDSTLILWDPLEGRALRTFRDEAGRSFTASFLDDRHAVSGGSSSDVRFWSLYDERELRHIVVDGSPIYSMVFSSDEQMVLVGQQDTIRLLELATGDELRRFHFAGGAVMSIALSPDDRIVDRKSVV